LAYVYKITNTINNKVYIGQTTKSISERFSQHKYTAQRIVTDPNLPKDNRRFHMPIAIAMAKHGIENFNIEIVEECHPEQLDEKEIYWIQFYQSYDMKFGYNATLGGSLTKNYITKEKADEIIRKFNEGDSLHKLADYFHLGESTILILLRQYGEIGDQSELIGGRYIPYSQQQLVIDLYQKGNSLRSVAAKSAFGRDMVRSILTANDIRIRSSSELHTKEVAQYDLDDNLVAIHPSQSAAGRAMAEQYGYSAHAVANAISKCCINQRSNAYGFKWLFWSNQVPPPPPDNK